MTKIQEQFETYIAEETPFAFAPNNWKIIPSSYLYQFFDSIGINVSTPLIAYKRRCDFGAQVAGSINGENLNVWRFSWDSEWEACGYISYQEETSDYSYHAFNARREAEIAAFTKAFELAETIID